MNRCFVRSCRSVATQKWDTGIAVHIGEGYRLASPHTLPDCVHCCWAHAPLFYLALRLGYWTPRKARRRVEALPLP